VTKEPNLREIEKKAYMSYHQDGLLDIFVGVYILGFGLGVLADVIWRLGFGSIMPAILVAIILPIWIAAKRKINAENMLVIFLNKKNEIEPPKFMPIFDGNMIVWRNKPYEFDPRAVWRVKGMKGTPQAYLIKEILLGQVGIL
jgi:hypothetical protein